MKPAKYSWVLLIVLAACGNRFSESTSTSRLPRPNTDAGTTGPTFNGG
jgi:hypothetical protein